MFYLIGIGLKPEHITREAFEALKKCTTIYCENYTSMFAQGKPDELELLIGKKIKFLDREEVEHFDLLFAHRHEKEGNFALLVFGNPLIATTHQEILFECQKMTIPYLVIPGISIVDFLPFSGIDGYKFGRTCTIVAPKANFAPESFFDIILKNKEMNLHTLCLMEITEEKYFMPIHNALGVIEKIATKRNIELEEWIFVGMAGMGNQNQQIKAGSLEELKKFEFTILPQCLVICGQLNEKELEGLKKLAELKD